MAARAGIELERDQPAARLERLRHPQRRVADGRANLEHGARVQGDDEASQQPSGLRLDERQAGGNALGADLVDQRVDRRMEVREIATERRRENLSHRGSDCKLEPSGMRHTRIIATVGPACDAPDTLERLIGAGVDVFRLNFSHGSHETHAATIARIRDAAARAESHGGDPSGSVGTEDSHRLASAAGSRFRCGPASGSES